MHADFQSAGASLKSISLGGVAVKPTYMPLSVSGSSSSIRSVYDRSPDAARATGVAPHTAAMPDMSGFLRRTTAPSMTALDETPSRPPGGLNQPNEEAMPLLRAGSASKRRCDSVEACSRGPPEIFRARACVSSAAARPRDGMTNRPRNSTLAALWSCHATLLPAQVAASPHRRRKRWLTARRWMLLMVQMDMI